MKKYIVDFVEQFFDKSMSKPVYTSDNLPLLTHDADRNLKVTDYFKFGYPDTCFYVASYYKNTFDPEYDKVFPEYLSKLLNPYNLDSCANYINHSSQNQYNIFKTYKPKNGLWVVENILKDETIYFFLFEKNSYDKLKTKMKYSQTKKTEKITDNPKEFTFLEKLFYSIDSDKTPYYYEDNIFYPKSLQNLTDSLNDYYENDFDDIKAEVCRISAIRETFQDRFPDEDISLKNIFEIKVDDIQDDLIKKEVEDIIGTIDNRAVLEHIITTNDVRSYIYNVFEDAHTVNELYKNYVVLDIDGNNYFYMYIAPDVLNVLYTNRNNIEEFNDRLRNYTASVENEKAKENSEEIVTTIELKPNEVIVDKDYLQNLENAAKKIKTNNRLYYTH